MGDKIKFIDRKIEEEIMNGLSDKGFGHKVLLSYLKKLWVEEFQNGDNDLEITEFMEDQYQNLGFLYNDFVSLHPQYILFKIWHLKISIKGQCCLNTWIKFRLR